MMLSISRTIFVAVICLPTLAVAELNAFSPGDPIRSSAMNDNFEYLEDQIKDLEAQVESLSQGAGFLTSCSRSDLAGRWIGASADAELGYRGFSFSITSLGNISGEVATPEGNFDFSGTINIRSDCTLSSLSVTASSVGLTVDGAGYGALSRDGGTLVSAVQDTQGYSAAFTAVKLP
jgi:hypothetical protein